MGEVCALLNALLVAVVSVAYENFLSFRPHICFLSVDRSVH